MSTSKNQESDTQQSPTTLLEDVVAVASRGFVFANSRLGKAWRLCRKAGSHLVPHAKAEAPAAAPAVAPAPIAVSPSNHPVSTAKVEKWVLLIESEWLTGLMLKIRLRQAGLKVEVTSNGCVALQKVRSQPPDAILVEATPSGIELSEVLKEARRDAVFSNRPIYVLGCDIISEAPSSIAEIGATKYFNRFSRSADQIVAEIAAELLGAGATVSAPVPGERNELEVEALKDIPSLIRKNVEGLYSELNAAFQNSGEIRSARWKEFRGKVRSVSTCAAVAGIAGLALPAAALDNFLSNKSDDPNSVLDAEWQVMLAAAEVLKRFSEKTADQPTPSKLTAVVVEEDAAVRSEAGSALLIAGFDSTGFATGAAALDHMREKHVDLLLLNVSAPDGGTLCAKLAELSRPSQTAILFLTNNGDTKPVAELSAVGATQLVPKPFTAAELILKAITLVYQSRSKAVTSPEPTEPSTTVAEPAGQCNTAAEPPAQSIAVAEPTEQSTVPQIAIGPTRQIEDRRAPDPTRIIEIVQVQDEEAAESTPDDREESAFDTAVLLLSSTLKITAAHPACAAIFQWDKKELEGRELGVLLQGGLDNELGKVLQTHEASSDQGVRTLRVQGLKKSGVEFPGEVTLKRLSGTGRFRWTAAFKDLSRNVDDPLRPAPASVEGPTPEPAPTVTKTPEAVAASVQGTQPQVPGPTVELPTQKEPLTKDERETLVERLFANEMEIARMCARLKRETKQRKQLEHEMQQFTTGKAERAEGPRNGEDLQKTAVMAVVVVDAKPSTTPEAAQNPETGRQQDSEANRVLIEQLTALQQARDEAHAKIAEEQQARTGFQRRLEELEKLLRENTAALDLARADLAKRGVESQTKECLATGATKVECPVEDGPVDRATELNPIDGQIRETVSALARTTAELEKERGHRRRSEQRVTSLAAQLQALHQELSFHLESEQDNQKRIAVIEKDLLEREEALAQARAEFEKQTADRQLAEDQLRVAGDLSERLESNLAIFEEAKKTFKRAQEDMGSRLEASLRAWKESESKLQKEVSERQQLEEALLAVRRELQEQAKENTLESSKLDAARQLEDLERKRSEGDVLRSYYLAMDSARQSQTLLNNLRRQVGESLQDLRQAAGQLLQADLREEQRKMAENVLENALFLQTSLQQASGLNLAGPAPVETRSAAGDVSLTSRLVEVPIPQRGRGGGKHN